MTTIHQTVLILENSNTMASKSHKIICRLIISFQSKLNDSFFGMKINRSLPYLTTNARNKFLKDAELVYERSISYLEKYYDTENSIFQHFAFVLSFTYFEFQVLEIIPEILKKPRKSAGRGLILRAARHTIAQSKAKKIS